MSPAATRMAWILGLAGGAAAIVAGVAYSSSKSTSGAGATPKPSKTPQATSPTSASGAATVVLTPNGSSSFTISLSKGGVLIVYPPTNLAAGTTPSVSADPTGIMGTTDTGAGGGTVQTFAAQATGFTTMTFTWMDTSLNAVQTATVAMTVFS